ncbi:hypothetical protein [Actinophytocola sp.]|uniref:hypothetical protein n=1 Tax=Actinophytocola sp. TaxID=1872138 RepID=UPI002D4E4C0E|nr:hypothetical protein [Actinophytocola sp.]HYQ67766.1 hypothetical protein [Actinophytocola sp.]
MNESLDWSDQQRLMRAADDEHGVSPPQHAITEEDVRQFPDHFLNGAGQFAAEQSLGEHTLTALAEELLQEG